jgi:hypothetical protein
MKSVTEPVTPGSLWAVSLSSSSAALVRHKERADSPDEANNPENPPHDAADDQEDDARDQKAQSDDVGCHRKIISRRAAGCPN